MPKLEAATTLRDKAADKCDALQNVVKEASMAKLFASRMAMEVALEAIPISGVHGIVINSALKQYLLDAKSYEVAGGSLEVLLNTIANIVLGKPSRAGC